MSTVFASVTVLRNTQTVFPCSEKSSLWLLIAFQWLKITRFKTPMLQRMQMISFRDHVAQQQRQ